MKAIVFPGQGSQKKGMGAGLFDDFAEMAAAADAILGYSIKELCVKDPEKKLNLTEFTQPALYVVNALTFEKKNREKGESAGYLAGHSLGEYAALFAAGVFSFETGLKLVQKRGELMGKVKDGGMAAILNLPESRIREILAEADLPSIDIANLNSPSQIVISGSQEDLNKAQPHLEKAKAAFIPLNTSAAFHSRFMREAEEKFGEFALQFEFSAPKIPVIANVTAQPYEPEGIRPTLVRQISNCVRWTDSVRYLLAQGVEEFEESGPGDVLTKLIGKIRKDWTSTETKETVIKENGAKELEAPPEAPKAPAGFPTVQMQVDRWNENHPIGSKMTSPLYAEELTTRTAAVVLFGHRAAVYMEGYNGYFDLRELEPVKATHASYVHR